MITTSEKHNKIKKLEYLIELYEKKIDYVLDHPYFSCIKKARLLRIIHFQIRDMKIKIQKLI